MDRKLISDMKTYNLFYAFTDRYYTDHDDDQQVVFEVEFPHSSIMFILCAWTMSYKWD